MRRFFIVFLLVISAMAWAQNPIFEAGRDQPQIYIRRVPTFIADWSRVLQRQIADFSTIMKSEGRALYGLAAFLSAVLFGIVHVAGPGHGKIFTVTYFGSKKSTLREGVLLSGLINVIDSLSAGLLILVGYGLLSVAFSEFRQAAMYYVQLASYSLITLFGVFHLVHHLRHSDHEHDTGKRKSPWALALSIGLVPCPVSTLILIFGLTNDMLGFAVLLVGGVSLGGFITMTALALAIIGGKRGFAALLKGDRAGKTLVAVEYVSSALIIVAGAALLISAL